MKIVIGGDHAGFYLKEKIVEKLSEWGHEVNDVGCYSDAKVDFPDIALKVCRMVQNNEVERGAMICGTGIGAAIAANKFKGIRAALVHDMYSAHQCVEHDNANIICMGAQIIGDRLAFDILKTYLSATFSNKEQFIRRIEKLSKLEETK